KPADVVNLEPGATPFPESVIDMVMGGLGWPEGGWPEPVWRAVLGDKRFKEAKARYLASLKPQKKTTRDADVSGAELARLRAELAEKLKREVTDDDVYSHLMYPAVFADFAKHQREYGDVSVLPTPAFFYGLKPGEEISVEIEEGKVLIIRLISMSPADKDGRRTLSYELNGIAREAFIADKSVAPKSKSRPKADLSDPMQVAAPIPGLVVVLSTTVGAKVAKGDKLFMMEAMKMQTTVYAQIAGVVAEVNATVGETVEAKDLIVKLRPGT
ncbi:MAG: biotin/lipoyl-containing protein, partial [Opitutus sp.]